MDEMNNHRGEKESESLPPGVYVYTSELPEMMEKNQPSYSINLEPVWLNHLLMHLNKDLQVVTVSGTLEGKLTGAAVDHLQLTVQGIDYHIRYPHVVYFRKA
ncbi:DUF2642 domain-containing protein [Aquibacillus halophilus]|uniref:DUF2642 domain-containing protein n=1 Tax=Aquibacillus halophilus TaxID=930132 RepID=A0A6A8DFX1_9BACI|nr:DUF2642 domain-containing protein [Aquibacillus halophilus]MRH42749.1 DUF2642 domain-containing protein [Aquibacillus halophilus]